MALRSDEMLRQSYARRSKAKAKQGTECGELQRQGYAMKCEGRAKKIGT